MSYLSIIISLTIAIIFIVAGPLISYYFSKSMVSWFKNVQRIDNRKDLNKFLKLKEVVKIVREISRVYRIKMPEVGVYPSQEINAFATGPANDTLIAFSTNLINRMSMEEIKGVIGHELSHLIHYDLRRILLVQGIFEILHWILSFFLAWLIFRPRKRRNESEREAGDMIRRIFSVIFFQIITGILRLIGLLFILAYIRKREFAADLRGAKIVGVDNMLTTLRKLLAWENKSWIVDGMDLTEDDSIQQNEPNSISLLKFNPEKKRRGLLDLFRTHPTLEERIERLERLKKTINSKGSIA